jgi:hypothetical protein
MARFILRVDDVGWLPDHSPDYGLEYFAAWRKAAGLSGLPVYYGAIPSCIGDRELKWLQENLAGREELSVHGCDHARGANVTRQQMADAIHRFRTAAKCRSYIAPFNKYTPATVRDWNLATAADHEGYFFGGFDHEHHQHGNYPVAVDGHVVHLPAFRPLYDHTEPLTEEVPLWCDTQCPLVVTLHCTWGHARLDRLAAITELLLPHLMPIDLVQPWLERSRLNLKRLTAAHYFAQRWVLERIKIGDRVLDFGARDGEMPSQMALRGCTVSTVDRDSTSPGKQHAVAGRLGVELTAYCSSSLDSIGEGYYDVVTATWAIQHNLPGETEIPAIAAALARRIRPGGRLLIVSSHSSRESFDQIARPDPQRVLSWVDHQRLIVQPSGCQLAGDPYFFQYEHATAIGGKCRQEDANAVAYELRKPA